MIRTDLQPWHCFLVVIDPVLQTQFVMKGAAIVPVDRP